MALMSVISIVLVLPELASRISNESPLGTVHCHSNSPSLVTVQERVREVLTIVGPRVIDSSPSERVMASLGIGTARNIQL